MWKILHWLTYRLAKIFCGKKRVPKPGTIKYDLREREQMADRLIVTLQLPPAGAPDVVSRSLVVTTPNGSSNSVVPGSTTSFEFTVEQDALVTVELVDIDDSGNKSLPSTLRFTAVDSIPPPAPGTLSVSSVREDFTGTDSPQVADTDLVLDADPVDPVPADQEPDNQ